MVNMTNKEYREYVKVKTPNSPLVMNLTKAFVSGGLICVIAQAIMAGLEYAGANSENAPAATAVIMVFLGAFLTGINVYDAIAKHAGAGTVVPITGFANSIVSPALEFKSEGFITGMAAKMFVIAGPVLVFGLAASVLYGVLYCLFG